MGIRRYGTVPSRARRNCVLYLDAQKRLGGPNENPARHVGDQLVMNGGLPLLIYHGAFGKITPTLRRHHALLVGRGVSRECNGEFAEMGIEQLRLHLGNANVLPAVSPAET